MLESSSLLNFSPFFETGFHIAHAGLELAV